MHCKNCEGRLCTCPPFITEIGGEFAVVSHAIVLEKFTDIASAIQYMLVMYFCLNLQFGCCSLVKCLSIAHGVNLPSDYDENGIRNIRLKIKKLEKKFGFTAMI